ncbi:sigma-70 family RNA polymerase sigma factor [Candidatus Phytoplasma prunorum]|uniref:sigma-70 family RNA polymerase sigma factor n=1 Tax=Candidatus Phytoplasma prunorum TaxID=47565 RepID=UPI002FF263EC
MVREKLLKEFLKDKNNLALRNQLIMLYLKDVEKISQNIKHYPWPLLNRADLYQEGILGIMEALKNYDPNKNNKFSTYLFNIVKFHIQDLIRKFLGIKKHEKKYNHLMIQTTKLDLSSDKITDKNYFPLNPEQLLIQQINHQNFFQKIKSYLSPNEFKIIRLSFGIPLKNNNQNYAHCYTNFQIAKKLKLTSRQVETFKNIAIKKLKNLYQSGYLKKVELQYL